MYVVWWLDGSTEDKHQWIPVAEFKEKVEAKKYEGLLDLMKRASDNETRRFFDFYNFGICEKGKPYYVYCDKDHDQEKYPEYYQFCPWTMSCTIEECILYFGLRTDQELFEKPAIKIKKRYWCPGTKIFDQCRNDTVHVVHDRETAFTLAQIYDEMKKMEDQTKENNRRKNPERKARNKKQKVM